MKEWQQITCQTSHTCTSDPDARAVEATSPGETHRHGTLWTIKQWKRLAHHVVRAMCDTLRHTSSGISDVDPHGTAREMKHKKSNVANLLEAQWMRGKALPRGNWRIPWKKAPTAIIHRVRSRREATW